MIKAMMKETGMVPMLEDKRVFEAPDRIKLQAMVAGFSQRKRGRALRKRTALTGFVAPSLNFR